LIPWWLSAQNDGVPPIVIGVAGGSGSRKTTVVRRIVEAVGAGRVTALEHDRYVAIDMSTANAVSFSGCAMLD
jgi:uridine kinase